MSVIATDNLSRNHAALAIASRPTMGREVRMVPADWQHPCYPADHYPQNRAGKPIPLMDFSYAYHAADWDEGFSKWRDGFVKSYSTGEKWAPKTEEHTGRFTEWYGARPSPDDYMPTFEDGTATHLMMYENTSEGTPISPAFATLEELARWLADNNASAFGSMTASYEEWLAMAKLGWAPSAVMQNGEMQSGVEAISKASPNLPSASQEGETNG